MSTPDQSAKQAFNVEAPEADPEGALAPAAKELAAPLKFGAWTIFVFLLMWSSGFPMFFAFIWQQCGGKFSQLGLAILFPVGFFQFELEPDGSTDLFHKDYLTMHVPWFVLAILWEWVMIYAVVPVEKRPMHLPRANDAISSLNLGILNVLIGKVLLLHWGDMLYNYAYENWRVTDYFSDVNSPLNFWLAFTIYDLMYYLKHRYAHWFSWLWLAHVSHHSSEEFNLSTALRQPATGFLTPEALFSFVGLSFLFPEAIGLPVAVMNLVYQFWIHTQLVPPLGKLEYILNTPGLHRIHHVRNPELFSKNYGAFFAIWDWMGGTLELEDATNEARGQKFQYGLVPVLHSWDPIWANFHHIHHMFCVQSKWHGLWTPFMHWTPPGGKCPKLGSRLNPWQKYDKKPQTLAAEYYSYMQFGVAMMIAAPLMLFPPSTDWLQAQTGLGAEAALTLQWAVIWSLLAAFMSNQAAVMSADTPELLRRALTINACIHCVGLAAAVAVMVLLPTVAVAVGTAGAVYAVVHGVWIARIWPGPVAEEASV